MRRVAQGVLAAGLAAVLAGCAPGIAASTGTMRATSVAPDGTTTRVAGAGVGVSVFGDARIGVTYDPADTLR